MSMEEIQLKFFDKVVEILVDLYEPTEDEVEETHDDMLQVTTMIFESLDIKVESAESDRVTFRSLCKLNVLQEVTAAHYLIVNN